MVVSQQQNKATKFSHNNRATNNQNNQNKSNKKKLTIHSQKKLRETTEFPPMQTAKQKAKLINHKIYYHIMTSLMHNEQNLMLIY